MTKTDWKKCKLGDVCYPVSETYNFSNREKVVFINTGDISFGKFLKKEYEPVVSLPGQAKKSIQKNDILFSEIRPANGRFALVDFDAQDFVVSTKLMVLRSRQIIDLKFLYLLLTNKYTLAEFQHIAESRSGTFPQITFDAISYFPISLPPLEEQTRIAEVLGAFDDKIELLQKQNKTLEDMAKALFKSWFVDFDVVRAKQKGLPKADIMREYHLTDELYDLFPSSFADSPLGPIPSGWEVKPLKDLTSITAGKRPKQVKDIKDDNFFIPVYGGNGIKWWTNVSLYSTPIIITGRVGTLGKVYRIHEPVWVSDNALIFEVKKELFEYLLYMLQTIDFNSFNRGSTQPLITQSDIKEILAVFDQNIVQTFHSIVVEYEKKINNNNRQIQTLTELRDSLLPRLISGKIRVLIH